MAIESSDEGVSNISDVSARHERWVEGVAGGCIP